MTYAPGDRLWVRETLTCEGQSDGECLYRSTVADDTGGRDYPDAEYILAAEHDRLIAEKDAELAGATSRTGTISMSARAICAWKRRRGDG